MPSIIRPVPDLIDHVHLKVLPGIDPVFFDPGRCSGCLWPFEALRILPLIVQSPTTPKAQQAFRKLTGTALRALVVAVVQRPKTTTGQVMKDPIV